MSEVAIDQQWALFNAGRRQWLLARVVGLENDRATLKYDPRYEIQSPDNVCTVDVTSLNLGNTNVTIGGLSNSGTGAALVLGVGTAVRLTISQSANSTFGGVMQESSGTLSIVKAGSGMLTLLGANTYIGSTAISGERSPLPK